MVYFSVRCYNARKNGTLYCDSFESVAKVLIAGGLFTVGVCCVMFTLEISMPSLFETQICHDPSCFQIPPRQGGQSFALREPTVANNGTLTWNTTNLIFKTQCGAEFVNMAMNITYNLTPTVQLNCQPVTATILEKIESGHTRFCKGSANNQPNPIAGQAGMHTEQIMSKVDVSECFWQGVYTVGYMSWFGTETAPNWQFCLPTVTPLAITRSNGTNTSSMGTPSVIWQSNPYSSFSNGFYQNGTHQVTLTSGTVDLTLGGIAFNTSLESMAMSHWTGVQPEQDPILLAIESTVFSPLLDTCEMVVSIPRNSSWVELNNWCQQATVVNASGMITFSALDSAPCNFLVGNPKAGNWSVTVGQGSPYRSTIATQWTCSCSG